jgi:hypothetical protein
MSRLIFVIGPARSGTHLVASTIVKGFSQPQYLPEINEFWSRYTLGSQDRVDPKYYSERYWQEIRDDFWALSNGADVLVEKTAANCLRIDFLKVLFPHAQFIFVQRDCFQIIKSVLKKQRGNVNKVSNSQRITVYTRLVLLIDRVKAKLSIVKSTPKSLFSLAVGNYRNVLNILNWKSDIHWGPRFCSKHTRMKIRQAEIYAFLQWNACDTEIGKVKLQDSESNLFLQFEEICGQPLSSAEQLETFLACNKIVFEIDARVDITVNKAYFEFYDLIKQFSSRVKES